MLSREGVLPFAPSLDTVGFFTETASDMRELVLPPKPTDPRARSSLRSRPADTRCDRTSSRRRIHGIGYGAAAGVRTPAARLAADQRFEGARTHDGRWHEHGDRIGIELAGLVRTGLAIPQAQYEDALETVARMREVMAAFFAEFPAVLRPAATGPAPLGLESTGDPRMNVPWTALGVPAIAIPMPVDGPPVGLQMTAAAGRDAALLEIAVAVERALC